MFVQVMWWLAQVAGGGGIAYILLWINDRANTQEPFHQVGRLAIYVLTAIFLIYMILRLFTILGHPLA